MWTHILCIAANIINVDNLLDNLSHHFELMRGQLECEEEGASTFFLAGLSPPTTGQKPGGEQSVLVESREQAPTADMQGPNTDAVPLQRNRRMTVRGHRDQQ